MILKYINYILFSSICRNVCLRSALRVLNLIYIITSEDKTINITKLLVAIAKCYLLHNRSAIKEKIKEK